MRKHISVYMLTFQKGYCSLKNEYMQRQGALLEWHPLNWMSKQGCEMCDATVASPIHHADTNGDTYIVHMMAPALSVDETPLNVGGDSEKPTPYRPQCLLPWNNLDTSAVDPPTFSNAPKIPVRQNPPGAAGKVHQWLFSKWVNINLSASASSVLPISCFPRWDL